jgi:pimeloyl-ACP methyl ester carboxylesterase
VQWEASVIKGSRVEIFEEEEGGNHMMFHENPAKFNQLVKDFAAK